MSVLVVGMSHRSAPVALLERLSMDETVRNDTTSRLVERPALSEAMIVSTCNRLEIYSVTNSFHSGVQDVVEVLHEISDVDIDTLRGYLYVRYADAAAEHMMVVASGLDSMVVGEQQIIGQVRTAYQEASGKGTVGPALHSLAQSALHTGKRVHSETDIDDAGASMVSVAVDEALGHLGTSVLTGRTALVLGAGAMASLAATHLGRLGIDKLIIANRTRSRAERLAEHSREAGVTAEVVDFDDRAATLSRVDLAVSATGADDFTITAADVPDDRVEDLMLIDLSMPRDIDDDTATLDGVHLVNIERLHKTISGRGDHHSGHKEALGIVAEELQAYSSEQRVRDVVPAVSALRRHAAELVEGELERLRSRTPTIDDAEFEEVTRTVRRVVDKLLHQPTVRVKKLAAESGVVSYESALQELFGLASEGPSVAVDVADLPEGKLTEDPATTVKEKV
ncbi:glutamyl-tRNA reductase [Corynebacterium suedekumii]|uniref:Glutamyl-tRNA reductase n=1 Tax=Corynebacterium suedekumii TaxID=3049801 RepID=A0ABY8VSW6_9CORY|nr:glutamyl-tRNA reductase [Corynebacterium suedekumii]WIM71238.1 glutamyl-tRNA reductase [Corynebacterium suedekumii]